MGKTIKATTIYNQQCHIINKITQISSKDAILSQFHFKADTVFQYLCMPNMQFYNH